MNIVMHRWVRLSSRGSFIGSATINFPPSPAFVQASLNYTLGGGSQKVGIMSFRFRRTRRKRWAGRLRGVDGLAFDHPAMNG